VHPSGPPTSQPGRPPALDPPGGDSSAAVPAFGVEAPLPIELLVQVAGYAAAAPGDRGHR
jgi:hypothetical protein